MGEKNRFFLPFQGESKQPKVRDKKNPERQDDVKETSDENYVYET